VKEFSDSAASGGSVFGRPGFAALEEFAASGECDAIIVEQLDRLSRDMEDLAGFAKRMQFRNVRLIEVHGGEASTVTVGLRGIVGQLFREDTIHKTRRGMQERVKDGMSAGGRAYGYRPVHGKTGELEIVEAEAAVVRRIFKEYIAGLSAKAIAKGLNEDGIPAPRGSSWANNTITGNANRKCGIVQNELYCGYRVWNKVRMVRDLSSGKRISRPNPPELWHRVEVPHLAIIDADTFAKAQSRKAESAQRHAKGERAPRVKHLLSDLLKCDSCGKGMSIQGKMGGRRRVRCTNADNGGLCTNRKPYYLDEIISTVVGNLRDWLADPQGVKDYVEAYLDEWRAAALQAVRERDQVARKLANAEQGLSRLVDALAAGTLPPDVVAPKARELEAERASLKERLAMAEEAVPKITPHPGLVQQYWKTMDELAENLEALRDEGPEAFEAVQKLVGLVSVSPGNPAIIKVEGRIMALIEQKKNAKPRKLLGVVAGEGLEPPTPGL
jgi:DNA invertase Pin-like site-specific DNA recombinase